MACFVIGLSVNAIRWILMNWIGFPIEKTKNPVFNPFFNAEIPRVLKMRSMLALAF